jgi:hypothetical protein
VPPAPHPTAVAAKSTWELPGPPAKSTWEHRRRGKSTWEPGRDPAVAKSTWVDCIDRRGRGRAWVAGLVLVACLGARAASAEPPKAVCAHDAEEGQRLRGQGKLREARDAFTSCASERCPALVRSDCSGWLSEVDAALPTVVVRATPAEDPTRELYDVEVQLDDVPLTSKLDGRELPVNPGEHRFRFIARDRIAAQDTLVVRSGEKHRLLTVVLPSNHPPAILVRQPAPPPPRVGLLAKVLLVGGGAALVTAAALGTSAWLDERSLRRNCAPGCSKVDVDRVRVRLRVADASLAIGALALAGAAVAIWHRPEGTAVSVTPVAGGALLAVGFGASPSWSP